MATRIIVSTSNDISTDNRVHKVCIELLALGYDVTWVGRQLPGSKPLNRPYKTKRFSLPFTKGALFYASLNIRLFFYLLFTKADVFLANDLDVLLPNFLASRLKRKKLVYDTHEYFLGVPEIQHNPLAKTVWTKIEQWIFPKLDYVFTVNQSIAKLYKKDYGKELMVFRNISIAPTITRWKTRKELNLPEDQFLFINQGSGINTDRGMEEALSAIAEIENAALLLVGSGDVIPALKKQVAQEQLSHKVIFVDRVPYAELMQYTHAANVGLSLDKDTNINYRYSLPNKLFDYIFCGIPVLCSNLIEVKSIVAHYNIGLIAKSHQKEKLKADMMQMMQKGKEVFKHGLALAKTELTWEKEKEVVVDFYTKLTKEIHGKKK